MGFSTIVGTIAFLFIFAGMVGFMVLMQKNVAEATSEQNTASAKNLAHARTTISINSASVTANAIVPWYDDTYNDFNGTHTGTKTVSPGTVQLTGPVYANGTYTGAIIDTGYAGTNYTTIGWLATTPAGTSVTFQVRAGATTGALGAASFTGPDGTTSTYYGASGTGLNDTIADGNRYIQYKAYLGTTNNALTPQLQRVAIGIQRFTDVVRVNISNTGSEPIIANRTDIYLGGQRVSRVTTSRTIDLTALTDQVLWQPGQSIAIQVFGPQTVPETVVIANGASKAAGTVS